MKAILTILTVIFLFIGSAGVSWMMFYPPAEVTDEDVASLEEELDFPEAMMDTIDKQDIMPVATRPEAPLTVEAVVELAQSIMEKEKRLFDAQQKINMDEKRVKLLFEDLSREQEELEAFAKTVDDKIRDVQEAAKVLKMEKKAVMQEKDALGTIEKRTDPIDDVAKEDLNRRVKVIKSWFENLEPEQAAKYLKEFADRGDLDFVAKLLDSLEDRRIAKVLAAFNDATLVAKIVDTFTNQNDSGKLLRR